MLIESPEQPELDQLCSELARRSPSLDANGSWPAEQLQQCAKAGVFRWFLPEAWGGAGWPTEDIMRGYLKLSAGCLTTTFIITQYTGAARRIASSSNVSLQAELLPQLACGERFATVGISHLTTSRRHLARPVLRAVAEDGGFRLDGQAPWVTGGSHADWILVGAALEDGRELLAAIPKDTRGLEVATPAQLVALSASHTGAVHFHDCFFSDDYLVAGPVEEVMKQGAGAGTGGVQTSTLAVGLARGAIEFLAEETNTRADLGLAAETFVQELAGLEQDVLRVAAGEPVCSNEELRTRANSLALRSTQAALTAAKGTGFLLGHPAGRWCREALFFLVWSCPQPVMAANLCELAGIE